MLAAGASWPARHLSTAAGRAVSPRPGPSPAVEEGRRGGPIGRPAWLPVLISGGFLPGAVLVSLSSQINYSIVVSVDESWLWSYFCVCLIIRFYSRPCEAEQKRRPLMARLYEAAGWSDGAARGSERHR